MTSSPEISESRSPPDIINLSWWFLNTVSKSFQAWESFLKSEIQQVFLKSNLLSSGDFKLNPNGQQWDDIIGVFWFETPTLRSETWDHLGEFLDGNC